MGSIPLPLIGAPIAPSFVPNPIYPPSLCPPPFSPRSLPYNIIRGSIAGVTKLPNLRFLSCLPHRSSPFVSHSSPFISHSSPFVSHSSPFVSHSSPFVSLSPIPPHLSPCLPFLPISPCLPSPRDLSQNIKLGKLPGSLTAMTARKHLYVHPSSLCLYALPFHSHTRMPTPLSRVYVQSAPHPQLVTWPEQNFYTGEVPPSFGGLVKGGLMRLTNKPLLLSSPFLSPLLPSSPLLSLPLPSSPFLIPPSGLSNNFYTGEVPPTFGGLSKLAYLYFTLFPSLPPHTHRDLSGSREEEEGNDLGSPLPSQLTNLKALKSLSVLSPAAAIATAFPFMP
ncbi:unnamed protein product [Closterium sp. Naga37s-1]|nr:unnamed protein product [Closterium sp. Naga37s-1]